MGSLDHLVVVRGVWRARLADRPRHGLVPSLEQSDPARPLDDLRRTGARYAAAGADLHFLLLHRHRDEPVPGVRRDRRTVAVHRCLRGGNHPLRRAIHRPWPERSCAFPGLERGSVDAPRGAAASVQTRPAAARRAVHQPGQGHLAGVGDCDYRAVEKRSRSDHHLVFAIRNPVLRGWPVFVDQPAAVENRQPA
ncbi:hypothetical protein D3C84_754430 [compost metagenome]